MDTPPILTPAGRALVDSLPPYKEEDVFTLSAQLRKAGHDPELVAAALTQSRLRQRAATKFGPFASRMFLTSEGLEQATRLSIAAHHAEYLRACGSSHVVDLGCGIGADSLAFAALGLRVTSIERDPTTAQFARENLAAFPEAEVLIADGRDLTLPDISADALWMDPARRDATGKRLKNPEDWAPPFSVALEIARDFPAAGIKVAPGIAHDACPSDSHVQWISDDGDVIEAVVWLGNAAPTPGTSALVMKEGRTYSFEAMDDSATPSSHDTYDVPWNLRHDDVVPRELGPFVYEPDPAIIRSGGIARLCTEFDLAPISGRIAYLSGDRVESPFLTAFEILEVLPIEPKAIKRALARLGITRVEIKKRGTDQDPEAFRAKLGLPKKSKAAGTGGVLLLSPVMGKHRAILARRVAAVV